MLMNEVSHSFSLKFYQVLKRSFMGQPAIYESLVQLFSCQSLKVHYLLLLITLVHFVYENNMQ